MIRQDKYEVGDIVSWDDEFSSDLTLRWGYGDGKLKVTQVKNLRRGFRGVGHTQWLYVNGEGPISGAYFKPTRALRSEASEVEKTEERKG